MNFVLTFALLVLTGALIGGIIFLSLGLAPTVFRALDAGAGSRLLRALFPRYYLFALICCALAPALALALTKASFAAVDCVALIITIDAVSGYCLRLIPRINAARDNRALGAFRRAAPAIGYSRRRQPGQRAECFRPGDGDCRLKTRELCF